MKQWLIPRLALTAGVFIIVYELLNAIGNLP